MVPYAWIFVALCLAPYVQYSQTDRAACEAALSEYLESAHNIPRDIGNLPPIFGHTFNYTSGRHMIASNRSVDRAKTQGAIENICAQFNGSARIVDNVISRCSDIPQKCPYRYVQMSLAPDVLWSFDKFCENGQAAEYAQHVEALMSCWITLRERHFIRIGTENREETSIVLQAVEEFDNAARNTTGPFCGFNCGRKCVCRRVQIGVPLLTSSPDGHIRDVCGQKEHDLVLMLKKRALNTLNCSEFGDYVKEWDWLKVNYYANQTTLANHY